MSLGYNSRGRLVVEPILVRMRLACLHPESHDSSVAATHFNSTRSSRVSKDGRRPGPVATLQRVAQSSVVHCLVRRSARRVSSPILTRASNQLVNAPTNNHAEYERTAKSCAARKAEPWPQRMQVQNGLHRVLPRVPCFNWLQALSVTWGGRTGCRCVGACPFLRDPSSKQPAWDIAVHAINVT